MKKIILIILIIVSFIVIKNLDNLEFRNKKDMEIKTETIQQDYNNLAIMLETEFSSGTYEESSAGRWPSAGYIFNDVLSYCENGTTLEWNDETNKVILKDVTKLDKCYVYFDKITFANTIKSQFIDGQTEVTAGANGKLFYHSSSLANGAGDSSYRYAGDNPDNYVCLGKVNESGNCLNDDGQLGYDNLYRIIGLFPFQGNEQQTSYSEGMEYRIKLIKSEYITEEELRGSTTSGKFGDASSALKSTTSYTYNKRVQNTTSISGFYWNTTQYSNWSVAGSNKYNLWEYKEHTGENKKATLNEALNTTYLSKLKTLIENNTSIKNKDIIADTIWHIAGGNSVELFNAVTPYIALQNEMNDTQGGTYPAPQTTSQAKIGLMYVSDYGFAAQNVNSLWTKYLSGYNIDDNRKNNWLYNGVSECTISRRSEDLYTAFYVSVSGNVSGLNIVYSHTHGVRPVFYLKSNVSYARGNGSKIEPYVLTD